MTSPVKTGRPAEKAGLGGGGITVIAALVGASTTQVAVLAAITAALPAVVTYLVTHQGIRGVVRSVWRGGSA